jgi:rhodanese-related sulfurtransferase
MGKKGTILICLIALVLLGMLVSSVAQAAPTQSSTISVSPASIEVSQGDTFTIEIMVDPKGEEIYAVQYDLYFDNNLLNATSQTRGTFLSQDGTNTIEAMNEINNSIGKVEYGETRTGESSITNSSVLASISFEVIGTSGRSDLKLGDVILSDINEEIIETEINDGTCTIGGVTGEPAVVAITVKEAHEMLGEEPEEISFLDVRTEKEYKEGHIPDAINIPKDELESRIGELDKSKKIVVYCRSGSISRTASETLVQNGFENVYNMLGGIEEWKMYFSVTSLLTPTPAIAVTPSPMLSPSPLVSPEGKWGLPGFEAAFTIMGVLAISYLLIRKRKQR